MKKILSCFYCSMLLSVVNGQVDSTASKPKDSLIIRNFTELPIKSQTQKVSITEILSVPNANQEELYKRIYDWYKTRSSTITDVDEFVKKYDPNGKAQLSSLILEYGADPSYTTIKSFEKIVLYFSIYNLKDIRGAFAPKEMSGFEIARLIILIKDGRYKVELTNCFHQVKYVRNVDFSREGIQWDYEMKKVDFSEKNWTALRLEGLNKLYQIMIDLTDFVRKNPQGDMNF